MKILAIKFGDNDFTQTFHAFLRTIDNAGLNEYDCETRTQTKQKIVELCLRSLSGLYWLAQNKLKYRDDFKPEEYLIIKENNIFIDEEAMKFMEENAQHGWNGEFHVLDTTGYTGSMIYSF